MQVSGDLALYLWYDLGDALIMAILMVVVMMSTMVLVVMVVVLAV